MFWLCIGLASVCAFMALRVYFISLGKQHALEELQKSPQRSGVADVDAIEQSDMRVNNYTLVASQQVRSSPDANAGTDARPWISVQFSSNGTEEEPDVLDSMIFENVGEEVALGVDIATRPTTFERATPRLAWSSIARVLPGPERKEEASVTAVESFLHRIRKALLTHRNPPFEDVRIPLIVSYSDRKARRWVNEYALVYNGIGIWVEDVTGRDPQWTDLGSIVDSSSD
jgi:hypothetical protein